MLTAEKSATFRTAALLTVAAMAARGTPIDGPLPIDPSNQDSRQRQINLQVWEIFRGFYLGLANASQDDTDFPPPPPASAKGAVLPPGLNAAVQLPAIASALGSNPVFAPLVTALVSAGVNALNQAVAPVPAPGVKS